MERVWPEVDRMREAGPVQSAQGQVWDAASVELATWIISEANQHPELNGERGIDLSYNTNAWKLEDVVKAADVYWPRLVTITVR